MNDRSKLYIILLTVFIDLFGFGLVIPILPLYAKHFGASEIVNGCLVAVFSLGQFLAAPIMGKISDRVGRKPVLFVGLMGTALGFFIMGWAGSLLWLFIGRIIDGVSGGNIGTAHAYVADITAPEDRSRAMGLVGVAIGFGFVIGPAVGGVLVMVSMGAPFYFAGVLALVNAALVLYYLPESLAKEHRLSKEDKAPFIEVLRHGSHLPALMWSYFFTITGFSILTTNFALFTSARFGYDQLHNGFVFSFIGVVGIIVQGGVLRQVLKKWSEKSIALAGAGFLAVGLALLPLSAGLASLLVFTGIISVGYSFISPTMNGLASQCADRSWQGRVAGLMQSAGSLARFIGPMIGGWLLSRDSATSVNYGRTPFWVGAALLVVGLLCMLRLPAVPKPAER